MSKPVIQFPLPRDDSLPGTLAEFTRHFSSEQACLELLRRWKYGEEGFRCPDCGFTAAWYLPSRRLDECQSCHRQVSLTSGTVMHGTRKPIRLWFLAMYLFVCSKQGISALELKRELGFASEQTAWAWLHKLRSAMAQRPRAKLRGIVEADETYEGGLEEGSGGRPNVKTGKKALIALVVERETPTRMGRARLASLESASAASLGAFIEEHVERGSVLLTDDWRSYRKPAKRLGLTHRPVSVSASGRKAHELLPAVHRVFSLVHRVLLTTYQGAVSRKHLDAYLAEYEFRFNRRDSGQRGLLFQRLLALSVHRAPPYYWEIVGREKGNIPLPKVA